jgi:hypothetical protein
MALVMGIIALGVVLIAVVAAIVFAGRQADEEAAPKSEPSDFVAPVSSGGYSFRRTDETPEQFKDRIAHESVPPPASGSPKG